MKKSLLTTIGALLLSISAFAYSGGNGTEAKPYLISSKADMQELASKVNGGEYYSGKYFRLTRDLTGASDTITTVVGNSTYCYFGGIFDGGGHEIAVNNSGIFGNIINATIKNLGVSGRITVYSYQEQDFYDNSYHYYYYAGGICGKAHNGTITNCYSRAEISITISNPQYNIKLYCGGICGYYNNSNITNCYNRGSVSALSSFNSFNSSNSYHYSNYSCGGGICGYITYGNISKCYNAGNVSVSSAYTVRCGLDSFAGGICGIGESGNITDSYNRGNISSSSSAAIIPGYGSDRRSKSGGICVGIGSSKGIISNCYSTGDVASSIFPSGISSSDSYTEGSYAGGICCGGNRQNCFVANSRITNTDDASSAKIGRIGYVGTFTNCYADYLSVSINGALISNSSANSKDGKDGKDATVADLQNQQWLTTTLAWDFDDIWKVVQGDFPKFGQSVVSLVLPSVYYGDHILLNAVSNNPIGEITYESSDPAIAEISGNLLIAKKLGTVTITASQAASAGFLAGSSSVELTVQKKELIVTPHPASITYGDALPTAYTYQYSGFANNETEEVLTQLPTISSSATSTSDVGQYTITPSGAEAQNYTFTYQPGILTIEPAPVTITAQSKSITYGDALPIAYACQYSGFVNNQTERVLTQPPTFSCSATATSNAGQYDITPSGAAAQNYRFIYLPGTLTIQKRNLQVAPNNVSRTYGDPNPPFTFAYNGFINGDTEAGAITEKPVATTVATAFDNTGSYPITCSGGSATSYNFTYRSGMLTVTKAPLNVSVQDTVRRQGEENPAFTRLYFEFKNNDDESVLDVLPAVNCDADIYSPIGYYPITLSGGSDNNYEYEFLSPAGWLKVVAGSAIAAVQATEISVYPNPAKHDLYIKSDRPVNRVEIYDQSGVCVLTAERPEGKIDVSALADGLYVARIYSGDVPLIRKIVIRNKS